MHSTLPSKPTDDPCDVVVVEPDAVRVAPSDEELSDLLHQAARHRSDSKTSADLDFTASPTAPPVDTTFRPTAGSGERRPLARRAARALITLLLAVCMGLTAVAWKSYGDMAKKKIAKLATQVVLATSMPPEKSEPAAQPAPPAVQTSETNTASPQASPVAAQTAPETTKTTDDLSAQSAQLLQSMARDLTSLGQEVEQLKASMEQLKASQQTSRHIADRSERNLRTRTSAPPPRSSAARAHRPMTSFSPPPIAAAPALPQAAPYYPPPPSRPQHQNTAGLPAEAELSSVPRPPMPVR